MSFRNSQGSKRKLRNGVIYLVFMSPFWAMNLNLSKMVPFLQYFADVSKKFKTAVAIYVYTSESSCFTLLENGIDFYAKTQSLEGTSI